MVVKKHNIEKLQQLRANITSTYKQTASQVITQYKSRHIKNIGTAQRILKGLTGTQNRQQTALNLITNYKQGAPATGELARHRAHKTGIGLRTRAFQQQHNMLLKKPVINTIKPIKTPTLWGRLLRRLMLQRLRGSLLGWHT